MTAEAQGRFQEASQYDAMILRLFACYEQLPLILLSQLRTRLDAKARVLDVGCGTGSTLPTSRSRWIGGKSGATSSTSLSRRPSFAKPKGAILTLRSVALLP